MQSMKKILRGLGVVLGALALYTLGRPPVWDEAETPAGRGPAAQ